MSYSIYKLFGSYLRGKFMVGGFKSLKNAKERCAEIISHYPIVTIVDLEIWDTDAKRPVGWMHSDYKGEKGIFYEDRKGNVTKMR